MKKKALENAKLAFWAEVAKAFPDATSGDVDHGLVIEFELAAENAIDNWIEMNTSNVTYKETA